MAGKHNFVVYQGSTFRHSLTVERETPVDLTGCIITMRATPTDNPPLEYSTTTGHIVITEPTEGKFTITITDEETALYTWSSAKYDIHIEFTDGSKYRLLEGKLKLSRKV